MNFFGKITAKIFITTIFNREGGNTKEDDFSQLLKPPLSRSANP
jgi:hypothetical protein